MCGMSNDIDSLKFLRLLRSAAADFPVASQLQGTPMIVEIDLHHSQNWLHVLGGVFIGALYLTNVLKRTVFNT